MLGGFLDFACMIDSVAVNCANLPKKFYGNVTENFGKTISWKEKGCYNASM